MSQIGTGVEDLLSDKSRNLKSGLRHSPRRYSSQRDEFHLFDSPA